jgi:hypothetical protein
VTYGSNISNSTLSEAFKKDRKNKSCKEDRKRKETIRNKGGKEERNIARKSERT